MSEERDLIILPSIMCLYFNINISVIICQYIKLNDFYLKSLSICFHIFILKACICDILARALGVLLLNY